MRPAPGLVPSGGTLYDERVLAAWRRLGMACRDVPLPGPWPEPDAAARARLAAALRSCRVGPDGDRVILDGLVGGCCPAELADARAGLALALLVHLPLDAEPGLPDAARARLHAAEQDALAVAGRVLVPSAFAARDLAARFALSEAPVVARPGQDPAPLADGSDPPLLVMVGAFTPGKNHALALAALAALTDRPWRLTLAGGEPARASTLPALRHRVAAAGLGGRVRFAGVLRDAALDALWAAADLLLLPSLAETYGMVVSEALARGVPCLVGAGTGAVEALVGPAGSTPPAGAALDPDDPEAWRAALARWLDDPGLRAAWRARAVLRRAELRPWDDTARTIARAVGG
nr:glycosyltransferase family 4 protein [Propionibacterium sp.]